MLIMFETICLFRAAFEESVTFEQTIHWKDKFFRLKDNIHGS